MFLLQRQLCKFECGNARIIDRIHKQNECDSAGINPYHTPTYHPISRLHSANMSRTLSSPMQCFVARSAYWITMNPLTTRRKALKVAPRPLPLSTSREKVSPLYVTRREEPSELWDLPERFPSHSGSAHWEYSGVLHSYIYLRWWNALCEYQCKW